MTLGKTLQALSLLSICLFISIPNALSQSLDDQLTNKDRAMQAAVESSILSPFCAGRLLKDCPSSAASELKRDIKRDILAGKAKDEIVSKLLEKYGDEYKAVPESAGFGQVAWFAPIVFLIFGFLFILSLRGSNGEESESEEDA